MTPPRLLADYIETINGVEFRAEATSLRDIVIKKYSPVKQLFEKLFCLPATSAPVERIFPAVD